MKEGDKLYMVFRSNELDLLILQNGKDGTPADSKYIWVKYSQNENGIPLTDDPTDAIYMGLSYNQESNVESDNPSDYAWIKIHGENGEDAYTVYLTNENVSFAIGYNDNKAIANQTYETEVKIFQGINERTDFTIGEINSANGITVDKNGHVITLSVNIGASITAEVGSFRIPINIDGLVFFKDITWSTSHQGAPGLQGEGALNVVVENESQMIACTNEGLVLENTLLSIPFSAYKGFDRIACTVSVGVLPSGITLGSNAPATATSSGEIVLNVAKNATLGNASATTGNIQLTFTVESQQFVRNFIWTKVKDGANGNTYSLELSTVVLSRGFNNTLSPSVITMNAYQMVDGEQVPYNGRFIISQQTFNSYNLTDENGSILTDENGFLLFEADNGTGDYENVYVSAQNENEYVYDISSQFISGMVVYLCEADNISRVLDQQTVVVLTNIDDIRPTITQIQTTMAGTVFQVDNINNQIINKVWQSDVIESINNYDQTTVQEIRDQQSQMVIDIEGISTNVSDITSTFEDDIQTLNEKTSQMEQDAEGFKTEVSETYATKNELNNTSETLQSSIEQTAGQINQQITNLEGDISTNTQNIDSITQRVESAEGSISELEQTATDIQLEVGRKKDVFPAKVRYIRDWLGENNLDGEKCWTGISVIVNPTGEPDGDIDIAHGLTPTSDISISGLSYYTDGNDETFVSTTETGMHYLQIDLNTRAFQDGYIIIKHANFVKKFLTDESSNILTDQSSNILYITEDVSNRRYEHKLEVSEDGTRWYTLYDSEDSGEYTEEAFGRTYFINDGYVQNNMAQLRVGLDGISMRVEQTENDIVTATTEFKTGISEIEANIETIEGNVSNVTQTAEEISSEIANARGDSASLSAKVNEIESNIESIDGRATSIQQTLNGVQINVENAQDQLNIINQCFNFTDEGLIISSTGSNSNISLKLGNDRISFLDGSSEVAYISNNKLHITSASIVESLQLGNFAFQPMANGSLSFNKIA